MDDDDTIAADPDEEETALKHITDGSTPDENREVGLGVED
jgi:hypothetical protein